MIKIIYFIFCFSTVAYCQLYITPEGYLRDSSFTTFSAFQKEVVNYPHIKIANADSINDISISRNLVYKKTVSRHLRFDLYRRDSVDQRQPAIILIHGGGWRSGDKSQNEPLAKVLASSGYISVSVEYRLSPEAGYPAAIHDLKSMVRFLRNHSSEFNIDSTRIGVIGFSSGGHLAAFLGSTNNNSKFEGVDDYLQHSSYVNAVVDVDGILDFTHPGESAKDQDVTKPSVGKLWLGFTFLENQKRWIEASPLNYIDKNMPPTLFLNSGIERFHAGRDDAIKILRALGTPVSVVTIGNCPHTFWIFEPWFEQSCFEILHFLDKIFQ
ncbi:MAG: alpha/beta hydrolase [Ignavibacteriales bacterium]|nr:MAG: alpha/beta hydrolase [Ignavibacteriales bacterium]